MSYVETYYSGLDFGNYSLLNNYIYIKQNDLVSIPTNYYINPDNDKKNINYSPITMDYDDNGIRNGTDHNIYTPEEVMIILNSVPKLSEVPGYMVALAASGSKFPRSIEFNIPCDGIFRYLMTRGWDNSIDTFTINDIKMDIISNDRLQYDYGVDGLIHSIPIRVNKSDRVKVTKNLDNGYTAYPLFYFLPFTYPWE